MNLEEKVKQQLLSRGFTNEQLLNNRGLIGAVIDETTLIIVKNLDIPGSEQLRAFAEYCDQEHKLFIPSWMIDNYNESHL